MLRWREAAYEPASDVQSLAAIRVDGRNPSRRTAITRNLVFLYGHRHRKPDILAKLIDAGQENLGHQQAGNTQEFVIGADYIIKHGMREEGLNLLPLPDENYTEHFRHD